MWYREYKDYPPDTPLIQQKVETGRGIIGCEMHELNGWGETYHQPVRKKRKGLFATLLHNLFPSKREEEEEAT